MWPAPGLLQLPGAVSGAWSDSKAPQALHNTTTIQTGLEAVVGSGIALGGPYSVCTDCTMASVTLQHTGNSSALATANSSIPMTFIDLLPESFPMLPAASGCVEVSSMQQPTDNSSTLATSGSTLSPTLADLLPESFPFCISSWQGLVNNAQLDANLQPDTPPVAEASSHSSGCFSEETRYSQLHGSQPSGKQKQRRRRRTEPQVQDVYAESSLFFAGCSPIATVEALMSVFDQFGSVVDINLFRPYRTCKTSKGCGLVIYSQRSEAVLAMDTLAGRFIWPGARTPIVLEWASKQQQQQQQQAKPKPKAMQQPPPQPPGLAPTGFGPIAAPSTLQQLQQVRPVQPPLWHPVSHQQQQQPQQVVTGFVPSFCFPPGLGTPAVLAPVTATHLGVVQRF